MTAPTRRHVHPPATADNGPPTHSKVTGGLAALACVACCAIPLLIVAGLVTGAGAALLEKTVLALAAVLAAAALGMWWFRRSRAQPTAGAGCGPAGCDC
ncbi:hypothetical protein [Micromonospora sp. WMMD812]|uniref:hypothetical protein n=1 Tax=Micromonospora sp. WMMD812 TaxID=3015152 RepID=UPI00248D3747|nr:hypothetical protein [Micromonospora sp. WMMD812]WBB69043.1 hypothetical protein O7603_06750 [Micromonospora sp. WMMD812]